MLSKEEKEMKGNSGEYNMCNDTEPWEFQKWITTVAMV